MDSDPIEKAIGKFGWYQGWILFLIMVGRFPTDFQLVNVVFIMPDVTYNCLDPGNNGTNVCPCDNPDYDKSNVVSSVTSEWNLICDRQSWASLAQSILQVGILAGSLIYGYLSDRYGRKVATLLALFVEAVVVIVSAFVTEFWMFLVARFLIGTSTGGTMLCCFIIVIELGGKSFRDYITGLHELSYICGYIVLPVIAYYVRDWRQLQLVTSAPWLLVIFYYWLIPESPRWLITVGRKQEAIDVLTHIAKRNRMPTNNIERYVSEMEKETLSKNKEQGTYTDLFKTPKLRFYTLIMAMMWLCCAHTFFGLNQYLGRLDGNLYLNILLTGTSHIPAFFLMMIAARYFKRKFSVITGFTGAGVCLVLFILVPSNITTLTLTLAIVGQSLIYISFVLIYLYSSEVSPTVIRNSALGFASVFARFGAFIAPFVVNIGVEWISITIFSCLAFCAAILCCFLPETKGVVLMNTVHQTETKIDSKEIKY